MTNTPKNDRSTRRPDCVTEIRIGNSVLVVSGYFKQDTTATAADKMLQDHELNITRLSVGLPFGGDLEYSGTLTLANAFKRRFPA